MSDRKFCGVVLTALLLTACAGNQPGQGKTRAVAAAKVNTQLGIEYLRSGNYELSRTRLEKAIRQAPDYPGAHDAIAVLYEQVGEMKLAEKHYLKSLKLDADNASFRNNYGRFLCKMRRYEAAEDAFKRAADNAFYRTPWIPLTNAGICMTGIPDNVRAGKYFRLALQKQPEYAPALMQMGKLSFARDNYLSTRAYLQRYQQVAKHTAESLWLAVRTEYALRDHQAWGNYAIMLKIDFPNSEQFVLLQEWEHERRSGN
jgi:type IV pilus assembly protein PilF